MRNYWFRILLGALAVFAVGMVGVTLVRGGVAKVHTMVEGEGPINIPLAFIPFTLDGHKLGTLERVTLNRDSPRHVSSVEVAVDLRDSLMAHGLQGCRLMANLDSDPDRPGVDIRRGSFSDGAFHCLGSDSAPPEFVEFGQAVFQPGNVRTPLFLARDLVDELQQSDVPVAADSAAETVEAEADSIAEEAERRGDSMERSASRMADSIKRRFEGFGDSLRAEGLRRGDSIKGAMQKMADSLQAK
jgi:hypothetical protein